MSIEKKLSDPKRFPAFAIVGAMAILSLFLWTTNNPDFWRLLLPIYVTQAIVYIGVDYALWKKTVRGSLLFLMSLVWLANQIFVWSMEWTDPLLSTTVWVLFIIQMLLTYALIKGYNPNYIHGDSATWSKATAFILLVFAVSKIWLNIGMAIPSLQMFLWGIAVFLVSLAYLGLLKNQKYNAYAKLFGVIIAVFSALTIGGAGLTLV